MIESEVIGESVRTDEIGLFDERPRRRRERLNPIETTDVSATLHLVDRRPLLFPGVGVGLSRQPPPFLSVACNSIRAPTTRQGPRAPCDRSLDAAPNTSQDNPQAGIAAEKLAKVEVPGDKFLFLPRAVFDLDRVDVDVDLTVEEPAATAASAIRAVARQGDVKPVAVQLRCIMIATDL